MVLAKLSINDAQVLAEGLLVRYEPDNSAMGKIEPQSPMDFELAIRVIQCLVQSEKRKHLKVVK